MENALRLALHRSVSKTSLQGPAKKHAGRESGVHEILIRDYPGPCGDFGRIEGHHATRQHSLARAGTLLKLLFYIELNSSIIESAFNLTKTRGAFEELECLDAQCMKTVVRLARYPWLVHFQGAVAVPINGNALFILPNTARLIVEFC